MQFSLRSLLLLLVAAAVLLALSRMAPPLQGLMVITAALYAGIASLLVIGHLLLRRGYTKATMLLVLPGLALYALALVNTIVIVLGLILTGLSLAF